ncbi:loganic acid O-methyltransferase-like [Telopea speciosissima]|uniref:loganic acid O-methyltransferase-like n=1 Tax=Telopea speciosissima TaxID=54955 RepID=UPI001CC3ED08|nr:loganic acid O-methyltransferase-like [Telopea speciosissima]
MEGEETKAFPMKGGDGPYSYAKNSHYQKTFVDAVKAMIDEAIADKLDIKHFSTTSSPFRIADFGCSVGPNSLNSMKNIVEAIEIKYHSEGLSLKIPEFQLFFNDHSSNDFNTLFASFPPDRPYFIAGVPGSFHGRLFPKASLHFVHSSYSLNWLSKVPKEVFDKNSSAWNKGKIHYPTSKIEVVEAYSTQFVRDMESFLLARAQELVFGGLMTLIIPGLADGFPISKSFTTMLDLVVGSCLMDMTKMGLVSEDKVDSFNFPIYNPYLQEMEKLIARNKSFSIVRLEVVDRGQGNASTPSVEAATMGLRAVTEEIIKEHFGSEIIDELFDRVSKKMKEFPHLLDISKNATQIFVVLKREDYDP